MITIKSIKKAKEFFREHPEGILLSGNWTDPEWKKEDFTRWFRRCLREKINRQDCRKWRKMDADYQRELRMDAWKINDFKARRQCPSHRWNYLSTPELKKRYAHIDKHIEEE